MTHTLALLLGLCLTVSVQAERICSRLDVRTALLQQVAEQTKQPVTVQVSGFSAEAQQVFNAAVKPKGTK